MISKTRNAITNTYQGVQDVKRGTLSFSSVIVESGRSFSDCIIPLSQQEIPTLHVLLTTSRLISSFHEA